MSQDIKAIYCQRTGCKDLVIKFDLPYWGFGRQFTSGQKLRLPNLIKRKTPKDEMSKKSDNSNSKHILSRPNLKSISTTLLTYDLVWIVQCAAIQLDTSSLTHIYSSYIPKKCPGFSLSVSSFARSVAKSLRRQINFLHHGHRRWLHWRSNPNHLLCACSTIYNFLSNESCWPPFNDY